MSEVVRIGYLQMAKAYFWRIILNEKSTRAMIEKMIDDMDAIYYRKYKDLIKQYQEKIKQVN